MIKQRLKKYAAVGPPTVRFDFMHSQLENFNLTFIVNAIWVGSWVSDSFNLQCRCSEVFCDTSCGTHFLTVKRLSC